MNSLTRRSFWAVLMMAAVVGVAGARLAGAASMPRAVMRAFSFPLSFANGVSSDLVPPAGSACTLSFETAKVAIGELPVPLPEHPGWRGRRNSDRFVRPVDVAPHARLLLRGVVDPSGAVVNSTGNQLLIDAAVSPSTAALSPPPFKVLFDIQNGTAFIDAPLPIAYQSDASVRVQILGVTFADAEGQPCGVLGFELRRRPSPPADVTPTPDATPGAEGRCFVGPNCSGPSFGASQERCCRLAQSPAGHGFVPQVSWCPADQVDPNTGRCAACSACGPGPHPSPTPGPCGDSEDCSGTCTVTCPDGTTVGGQCIAGHMHRCECAAECSAPPPCGVGQCFDTITFRCTGHPCGPDLHCPLPNQFCDVSGRRCPCSTPPPPPPRGQICCRCANTVPGCFDVPFVEVQPICPRGCETFVGQSCDPASGACIPPTACSSDRDCDDGNGCSIDRCAAGACTHDCVCVGPMGCGPGPGVGHRR